MPVNVHELRPIEEWDDAYANAAHIPNSDSYLLQWAEHSNAFCEQQAASGNALLSIQYGPHNRDCIDVFHPGSSPMGIAVFVHGGYWLRFSQRDWSHLAKGAISKQCITAMIGYPLCPESNIVDIASGVTSAVDVIAQHYPKLPIYLAGHSAGGQLVTHLVCKPLGLQQGTKDRIRRVLSISGVHDLVPLTRTTMNAQLGLSLADAVSLSPVRLRPKLACQIIAWAGGNERPAFIRQNSLLEAAWAPLGTQCDTHLQAGRHHFDVIDDLTQADSEMITRWLAP